MASKSSVPSEVTGYECPSPAPGMRSNSASATQRPSSGMTRGVQIVEYTDSALERLNPHPVTAMNDESTVLLEEYLCPRKLRALTGIENLDDVHFLELRVDTRDTSLGNFGSHVANLTQLKLSNSIITCVRDLGSCLTNVKVLWMARCCTVDLDGLAAFTNLNEVYLAFNNITDVSSCSLLERLQILDLEGNNVEDITQVEFLALCPSLTNLTLEGNPVCVAPNPSTIDPSYDYRATMRRILPKLRLLDDEALVDSGCHSSRSASLFDDDWKLIDDLVRDGMVIPDSQLEDMPGRPGTAWSQVSTYRPGTALKPQTPLRPSSSLSWSSRTRSMPGTADSGRPSSSLTRSSVSVRGDSADSDDAYSPCDLTLGSVVCGNTARALKNHRREFSKLTNNLTFQYTPEHTYDVLLESDEKINAMVEELRQWKEEHKKKIEEIDASRAPQILRIDSVQDLSDIEDDGDDDSESSDDQTYPQFSDSLRRSDNQSPKSTLPAIAATSVTRRPDVAAEEESLERVVNATFDRRSLDSCSTTSSSSNTSSGGIINISGDDAMRPWSGPVLGKNEKFRLEPVIDKAQKKVIDPERPVLRGLTSTPEMPRVPKLPRAGTSRAAIGQPLAGTLLLPSRLALASPATRQGAMAKIPLLPSRFTK